MGLKIINVLYPAWKIYFPFGNIDEQKISGSEAAGYSCEQTVFGKDCFRCFLIVS